jgi:hypothetical protein
VYFVPRVPTRFFSGIVFFFFDLPGHIPPEKNPAGVVSLGHGQTRKVVDGLCNELLRGQRLLRSEEGH